MIEYYKTLAMQFGKSLILNNFSNVDGPFLFISIASNDVDKVSVIGFLIVNSNYVILMAGSCSILANFDVEAKLEAIIIATHVAMINGFQLRNLLMTNLEISKALNSNHFVHNWRLNRWIHFIRQAIILMGNTLIHTILKNWAFPSFHLFIHGVNLHALTLYFQGRDLLNWIMKGLYGSRFIF